MTPLAINHAVRRATAPDPANGLIAGDRYVCLRPWGRMELICLEPGARHFRCVLCVGDCPTLGNLTGWTLYLDAMLPVYHAATVRLSS